MNLMETDREKNTGVPYQWMFQILAMWHMHECRVFGTLAIGACIVDPDSVQDCCDQPRHNNLYA